MEELVNFLIWTFTLLGLTTIVTKSHLLQGLRNVVVKINKFLGTMISCPPCFGFWAGLGLSLFYKSMTGNMFLDAVLGSGLIFYITYSPEYEPSDKPSDKPLKKRPCHSCGDSKELEKLEAKNREMIAQHMNQ